MTTTIAVDGLSCEHREQTVEAALRGVDGVTAAAVDRADQRTSVEGDADPAALVRAVEDVGYAAHV